MKTEAYSKLYRIAESQLGYFTSKQAITSGIVSNNHSYYLSNGYWKRSQRGIYRLVNFPVSDYEELMVWYLWSRDRNDKPQGVFSHKTALDIWELSDVNPANIHITVPKSFRKFNEIPKLIIIYRKDLQKSDVKEFQGFRVTTPLKTLLDTIGEKTIAQEIIRQAVNQAFAKGLITVRQIETHLQIKKYIRIK